MKDLSRRTMLAGSAVLGAALSAPKLAWSADADTINLGVLAPLTGPYAFTGKSETAGWTDAVDYANSQGGAAGKKFNLMLLDDEYKVDVGVAAWKKALAGGPVHFAKADSIPLVKAIGPENNDGAKMLLSATANGSTLTNGDLHYFFIPGPTYSDLMDIVFNQVKAQHKGSDKPRVALVHSNIEFGRDPMPHALEKAKAMGIDIVLEDETETTGVDVTASAIKLRDAKPDFVVFHGYAGNVWPEILRLSRDYGSKAQFMGTIWSVDPETVRGIGDAADGFIGAVPHTLNIKGNDAPTIKAIDGYLAKRDPNYPGYGGIGYMSAWAFMAILTAVFTSAVKAGKPLTGENLIAEVRKLQDWDSGGVFGPKVSIINDHVPYGQLYRYRVKDNKVTLETIAAGIKAI